MTISKRFEVLANGTLIGIFLAANEVAAIDAYAKDGGYKDIGELCAEIGSHDGEVKAVEEEEHYYWINANGVAMLDHKIPVNEVPAELCSTDFHAYPSQLQEQIDAFKLELLDGLVHSAELTVSDYSLDRKNGEVVDEQDYTFKDTAYDLIAPKDLLFDWERGYRSVADGSAIVKLTRFAEDCISNNHRADLARDQIGDYMDLSDIDDMQTNKVSPSTWARSLGQAYAVKEADEAEDEVA